MPTSDRLQTPSPLFNEKTFYQAFAKDLASAKREVAIYSPFISKYRVDQLEGTVRRLRSANVDVFIFTRPVEEYERGILRAQAREVLARLEGMGARVFCLRGFIHEKIAIIDREILWEGSLNILSQRSSREMMHRTCGKESANQIISWLGLSRSMAEGHRLNQEQLNLSLMAGKTGLRKSPLRTVVALSGIALASWWLWTAISAMMVSNTLNSLIEFIRALSTH